MASEVFLQVASTFNCTPMHASLQAVLTEAAVAEGVDFVQYTQISEYLLSATATSANSLGTLVILRVEDWLREEMQTTSGELVSDGQIRQQLRARVDEFISQLATLSDSGKQVWFLTCPSIGWVAEQFKLATLFRTYTNLIATRVRNLAQVTSLTWPAMLSSGQIDDRGADHLEQIPFTQTGFDQLGSFTGKQVVHTLARKDGSVASAAGESTALADYLAGLNLKVGIYPAVPDDRAHVDRLLRGTASFSLAGEKPSISDAEISDLLETHSSLLVTVSDRVSDYGPTGLILLRLTDDAMAITSMALSCVVLGKQVEYAVLSGLAQIAAARRLSRLVFDYVPASRNQAIRNFLESITDRESEVRYVLPVDLVEARVKAAAINPDAWTVTNSVSPEADLLLR